MTAVSWITRKDNEYILHRPELNVSIHAQPQKQNNNFENWKTNRNKRTTGGLDCFSDHWMQFIVFQIHELNYLWPELINMSPFAFWSSFV